MPATHAPQSHLEALIARRTALKASIQEELKRPARRDDLIRSMKSQNLRLKEEIEDKLRA